VIVSRVLIALALVLAGYAAQTAPSLVDREAPDAVAADQSHVHDAKASAPDCDPKPDCKPTAVWIGMPHQGDVLGRALPLRQAARHVDPQAQPGRDPPVPIDLS
jgi:hypothetical protein